MPHPTLDRLQEWLACFDAKERNHVLRTLLGPHASRLDEGILQAIQGAEPALDIQTPTVLFNGMDYHLDWLWAVLVALREGHNPPEPGSGLAWPLDPASRWFLDGADEKKRMTKFQPVNFTQQDADWIACIAEQRDGGPAVHFVLFECKYANAWGAPQLAGKLVRLQRFKETFNRVRDLPVRFTMLLMSPAPPTKPQARAAEQYCRAALGAEAAVPEVAALPWIRMADSRAQEIPVRVTRCRVPKGYWEGTPSNGLVSSRGGDHWGIVPRDRH